MPTYVFKCQECDHEIEVEHSIKQPTPSRQRCPNCKKNKLQRVLFAPHVYNKPGDDSITVGLLADRNADRLTDEQKAQIDAKSGVKRKEKQSKSFWETSDDNLKKISTMTPTQKKKYIETGEK